MVVKSRLRCNFLVGLSCKYKVASVTCLLSDFILPQNMVEHLHAFLFLFMTPENGISGDEMRTFVGALIQMQWIGELTLECKCVTTDCDEVEQSLVA